MTKPRVQLDALVIGAFMLLTGICVLFFPGLFFEGPGIRNMCDVLGFVLIVIGALLRMSGRGFKKHSSNQGGALVTGGPYKLVRNPMYLGTFLLAVGFMLPLYPLWTVPIFGLVFYARFIIQIRTEENWLSQNFGKQYDDYCRAVPSFFPTARSFKSAGLKDIFPPQYLWTTKEKYALIYWPWANIGFDLLEDQFLWGRMDWEPVAVNLTVALVLAVVLAVNRR
jgi:protein-S-isoprenylcysteine O-methyltransferase Ste14